MEDILNYDSKVEENLYAILGCDESASMDQIVTEYKQRALDMHPDKNPGKENAVLDFQQLNYAKKVLTDEGRRQSYDKWLRSGIAVPFKLWESKAMNARATMHWVTNVKKDPMLESSQDVESKQTSGDQTNVDRKSVAKSNENKVFWYKGTSNDEILRKFRNYEI